MNDENRWYWHSWAFKVKLLLVTAIIALPLSRVTSFQFSFVWYMLGIAMLLLLGSGWATIELWKDFRKKRD